MKTIVQPGGLPQYLRSLGRASLLAIAISMSAGEVTTNITSSYRLAEAVQQYPEFFGDGPYVVEYTASDDDADQPELEQQQFVYAMTLQASLARSGRLIGGLDSLKASLSDFEHIVKVTDYPAYSLGFILISLPTDPFELEELEAILAENSIVYFFPDGSNTFNTTNFRAGRGGYKA